MIRRPPRSTQSRSSAASDVYKRQVVFYDDPIRIYPKHVVSYSTSTVTKELGRTSLEIPRGRNCAGWNSGLGTAGACRTTATIQTDAEGVISYLSSIITKALGQTALQIYCIFYRDYQFSIPLPSSNRNPGIIPSDDPSQAFSVSSKDIHLSKHAKMSGIHCTL